MSLYTISGESKENEIVDLATSSHPIPSLSSLRQFSSNIASADFISASMVPKKKRGKKDESEDPKAVAGVFQTKKELRDKTWITWRKKSRGEGERGVCVCVCSQILQSLVSLRFLKELSCSALSLLQPFNPSTLPRSTGDGMIESCLGIKALPAETHYHITIISTSFSIPEQRCTIRECPLVVSRFHSSCFLFPISYFQFHISLLNLTGTRMELCV